MNNLIGMEDLIGMRQRYVLAEKKKREQRAKAIKAVLHIVYCGIFGIVMTVILLCAIQLLWVVTH